MTYNRNTADMIKFAPFLSSGEDGRRTKTDARGKDRSKHVTNYVCQHQMKLVESTRLYITYFQRISR